MLVQAYNPNAWEAEEENCWATQQVQSQPKLHRETLSQIKPAKQNDKKKVKMGNKKGS